MLTVSLDSQGILFILSLHQFPSQGHSQDARKKAELAQGHSRVRERRCRVCTIVSEPGGLRGGVKTESLPGPDVQVIPKHHVLHPVNYR